MKEGASVEVKRGIGTACDGMNGIIISIVGNNAIVRFPNDGDVELPIKYLQLLK